MFSPTAILIGTIVVSIILAGLVAFRPSVTGTRGGKILAFVSILLFPVLAASMGVDEHVERSKTTAFCTSCHVMENHGKSLHVDDASYLPAAHFQNNRVPRDKACYTCHTDYTFRGGFKSKLRGMRHLYVQYIGKIPEKIELYNAYNNRECLHCHGRGEKLRGRGDSQSRRWQIRSHQIEPALLVIDRMPRSSPQGREPQRSEILDRRR